MAYRDERDRCPRCRTELIDAGAVRACPQCHGQWLSAETLTEMAVTMQTVPAPVALAWTRDTHEPLSCPSCQQPMETWSLYRVPIDRCVKHGIWFDRDELMQVLFGSFRFGSS